MCQAVQNKKQLCDSNDIMSRGCTRRNEPSWVAANGVGVRRGHRRLQAALQVGLHGPYEGDAVRPEVHAAVLRLDGRADVENTLIDALHVLRDVLQHGGAGRRDPEADAQHDWN